MTVYIYKDIFARASYIKNKPREIRKIDEKLKPYLKKLGFCPMSIEQLAFLINEKLLIELIEIIDYKVVIKKFQS